MIRTSESLSEFSPAWVAAEADTPNVPKQTAGQVGNQRRKYADLDDRHGHDPPDPRLPRLRLHPGLLETVLTAR